MKKSLISLAIVLLVAGAAMAQNDNTSGSLLVKANLQSSVYMTLENPSTGTTLTAGAQTPTATMDLGNVSAYGAAPTNPLVVRTLVGSPYTTSFTLAVPFGVKVAMFNVGAEKTYTLTAALQTPDSNNTWTLDTHGLSTTPVAVTGGSAFGGEIDHSLVLTIPQGSAAGVISNTINLAATAQ